MKLRSALLALLLPVLIFPALAFGQYTSIVANHIQDAAGNPLAAGGLCVTPVNAQGQPSGFAIGDGLGQVIAKTYCFPVTSGSIGNSARLPDTALSSPAAPAIGYKVQVVDGANYPIETFSQPIYPSGVSFSVDAWAPTVAMTASPAGVIQQGSAAPTGACTPPSLYGTPTGLYQCVGSTWTAISPVTTASDIFTALGYTPLNKAGDTMIGTLNTPNSISKLPRVDIRDKDFAGGADPTGTNDSTAAIQAAIAFAVAQDAAGVGGNPAVYIAPGNYKVSGTLSLPVYLNVIGDGRGTSNLIETSATANLITVGGASAAQYASGSIRSVSLEGSGKTTKGTLLEVDNSFGYTIDNVQLYNTGGRGLQLNGSSERFSSHNLHIDYVRWPIIMPADENESYFVNTQITYPGQTADNYCYGINCVNGVAPGPNAGPSGAATPISPDTHAAIYVDGAENFKFLGGSIKPLGYMAGVQNFNSSLGAVSNYYFEGNYYSAWASDSPSVEIGGEAPRATLAGALTGAGLAVAVASADWQPYFFEDVADMPATDTGTVYVLMPADYLSGSTAASADVPGVERGQFEKVSIEGFAGDGSLHIYARNLSGSTAPAGTAWPVGTVIEEAPHTFGGYAAITLADDHFGSQEAASSGYAKNCNQLNTLTCAEIVAGFEPDGYWIDPTGGLNSNLTANVILDGDEMFSGGSDPYVGQIATHDNSNITIEGYANYTSVQSAGVVTGPYEYSISSSLGGSFITAPTYTDGRSAEAQVRDLTTGSTWWAAANVYSSDNAAIYGQGPLGGNSYMQGKQYANQYCFFDMPTSGTQPLNRFCFDGGPGDTANAGYEYDTWNGSAWVTGVNTHAQAFNAPVTATGITANGTIGHNSTSAFTEEWFGNTSYLNSWGSIPSIAGSYSIKGVSSDDSISADYMEATPSGVSFPLPVTAQSLRLGAGGPTWTTGASAPSGACLTGSLYSDTAGATGSTLYRCESSAWVADSASASGIADVSVSIPSLTIPANTCYGAAGTTTATSFAMAGLPASGAGIAVYLTGDPSALVGYGATGGLNIFAFPSGTAGTGDYKVCNSTSAQIVSSAINVVMGAK